MKRPKVVSITPEPSPELIEVALKSTLSGHVAEDFCNNLIIARAMFRIHRDLVEAPTFPEPFRTYVISFLEDDPQEEEDAGFPSYEDSRRATRPDLRAEYLPDAMELARVWARYPESACRATSSN